MSVNVMDVTDLEVPPVDEDGEDGEDRPGVYVTAAVTVFGLHREATMYFPEMPDDTALARELYNAVAAAALMQGSTVWFELQRLFAEGAGV